jgi:chemotaxis protein CheC
VLALTPVEETILSRTFGRGLMQAGLALAEMTGHEIIVAAPDVRRCSPADVIAMAGGPDRIVVGIYLGIGGSLSGHALLMLPPAGARRLARILIEGVAQPASGEDGPDDTLFFEPLEISALQEVGNVTISAFLNELGMHLHEPVMPSVPQAIVEMAGAILDALLVDLSLEADQVLAARAAFIEGYDAIEGTLLVLPRPDSLGTLLEALGVDAS